VLTVKVLYSYPARSGFDARRDIAGIILNRWGHAYVNPQPGFFFGTGGRPAPREVLRRAPFGRMAFANTDLVGAMDQLGACPGNDGGHAPNEGFGEHGNSYRVVSGPKAALGVRPPSHRDGLLSQRSSHA
jgi:hypothetical protein